jgi:DNA-binding MarR family transcriptional regulator
MPKKRAAKSSNDEKQVPHLTAEELLAWRGLLETEARLIHLLDEELSTRRGMTINEFDVLYQLWIAPGMRRRMKDLAAALLVTPGGVTRLASRLEERGWIRRVATQGVQAVEAELAPSGLRALDAAMDTHFTGVRRLFTSHLSPADVRRLAEIWERLRSAGG